MAQTTIHVRMDEDLKKEMEHLFKEFGINTTTAFTMFAKAVVRERKIPFEIAAPDPFYSEANMKHLFASIQQLNEGKGQVRELIKVE